MTEKRIYCTDVADISSRRITKDGFFRARGAMTRTGVFHYTADELGIPGGSTTVRVLRSPESVFHQDTVDSLKGAAITVGHPKDDVRPETWKDLAVGNVYGEPEFIAGNRIAADIMIGDAGAIDTIQSGVSELSIGYGFTLEKAVGVGAGYDYRTVGALDINHVAVVKRGRSGRSVRIFDELPEENEMNETEIKAAIAKSVEAAIKDALPAKQSEVPGVPVDATAISKAVLDAINPAIEGIKRLADEQAAAQAVIAKDEAMAKVKDAADELIAVTRKQERERSVIVADAMALIPEDKREALKDAEVRDVLVAAIGDAATIPEGASDDYVQGVFDSMKAERGKAVGSRTALVSGVTTAKVGDAEAARLKFEKGLRDAWKGEAPKSE